MLAFGNLKWLDSQYRNLGGWNGVGGGELQVLCARYVSSREFQAAHSRFKTLTLCPSILGF